MTNVVWNISLMENYVIKFAKTKHKTNFHDQSSYWLNKIKSDYKKQSFQIVKKTHRIVQGVSFFVWVSDITEFVLNMRIMKIISYGNIWLMTNSKVLVKYKIDLHRGSKFFICSQYFFLFQVKIDQHDAL